jgi:glyoxylate/hydroxypyruvate reductase A
LAILINIGLPGWMTDETLRDELRPLLPDVTMYCGQPNKALPDVVMLATTVLPAKTVSFLPNLALVQKLGAGVEKIVNDPDLCGHVQVARLTPRVQATEIAEYFLAYVLRDQRDMAHYEASAKKNLWSPLPPREPGRTTIGVLGLGHIGGHTARLFASLGFRVLGWSRSKKVIDGVDCRYGKTALEGLLSECDYVTSILPSTPDTRDLFDSRLLARMKSTAILINAGRGDVVVEDALIHALEHGMLGGAVLDTMRQEPLPSDHPFWRHPKISITPHVSGWHLDGGWDDVAENYRRLRDGLPLINLVDRVAGY